MSLFNGLNSSSSASDVPMQPRPAIWNAPYMNEAASGAYGRIAGLPGQDFSAQWMPQYNDITANLVNNPYRQGGLSGAVTAGQMGQNAATGMAQAGQNLTGYGQSLVPYAQQIGQTAFDPQSQLYARTQQMLQEQTRASQAARGTQMTPYGAGVENKAMSDFNIDWANQQLGRQIAGGNAMGSLTGQAGQAITQGQGLVGQAPGQYLQASQYPYQTWNSMGLGQQGAIGNAAQFAGQGQQLALTPIQQYLNYLQAGNQANSVANQGSAVGNQISQTGLNQAGMEFNQNQQIASNMGAGLSGVGNQNNWNWLNSMKPAGGGGYPAFSGGSWATGSPSSQYFAPLS